jgi:hypothetical protein
LLLWHHILEMNVLRLTNWLPQAWRLLNVALPTYILLLRGRSMNPPMLQKGTHGACRTPNIVVKCFAALLKTHGSQRRNWRWKA